MGKPPRSRLPARAIELLLCASLLAGPALARAQEEWLGTRNPAPPGGVQDAGPLSGVGEQLVEVTVNGREVGMSLLWRDRRGVFHASAAQLAQWGVEAPLHSDPLPLEGSIGSRFDEATQSLELRFPTAMLPLTRLSAPAAEARRAESQVIPSVFVNYAVQAEHVRGTTRTSALLDAAMSIGPGRLSHSQLLRTVEGRAQPVRLDTAFTLDDPQRGRRTVIGDSISSPGQWGKPIRFGGIRWGTDYALRPDLVTFPLPTVRGSAAVPSTVDVLVDGQRVLSQQVDAGPFEIRSLPVVTGQGNISLRVSDPLGQQQIVSQPFYASAALLAEGLSSYSVTAGAPRQNYLVDSNRYGIGFAMAQYRLGLSATATVEGRGEASREHAALGAGISQKVGDLLLVNAAIAASWQPAAVAARVASPSDKAVADPATSGTLASLGVEHLGRHWQFSASQSVRSAGFVQLGDARLARSESMPSAHARHTSQVFTGFATGDHSIGATWIDRNEEYGRDRYVALNYSVRAGSAFVTTYVGRTSFGGAMAGVAVLLPLGERESASLSTQRNGATNLQEAVYQQVPGGDQAWGYRLRVAGPQHLAAATLIRQSPESYATLDLASEPGGQAARLYATGTVVASTAGMAAVRNDGDSIALVTVPQHPGVRVYLENRPVAVTDSQGRAWVPGLRPYQANRLSLEAQDLPMDSGIDGLEMELRPAPRTVVATTARVTREQPLMARLVLPGRGALPSTATVYRVDERIVPTGARGEILLSEPRAGERLTARWADGQCQAIVPRLQDAAAGWTELNCQP